MTKGIGDKVLGWFIVQDEADAPASEPELVRAPATAAPPARAVPPTRPEALHVPAVAPGYTHDARAFAAVYRAAGVADDERERLDKVLSLLETLPHEATIDVKRAIVGASLEAFGVAIDGILSTGEGALGALDGYVTSGQTRTKEVLAQGEARIAKLTSEISEVRRLMDVQVAAQQELTRATTTEKARVRAVLDFFDARGVGSPVAPVAPRLVRLK